MASVSEKKAALFICLGNICRSPIAEAVFNHVAREKGVAHKWTADSAAIGDWHVGKNPDVRAQKCMKIHGVPMEHRARQLTRDDFNKFHYIFGMDENNIEDIKSVAPKSHSATIELLGRYDPEGQLIIRDPYYDSGSEGFEDCYKVCARCCEAFLDSIQ